MTRELAAERKLSWRAIGLQCLHNKNLLGFHRAYKIAKSIRAPRKEVCHG